MSDSRSDTVVLADAISDLLYGIVGWVLVGLGVLFGTVGTANAIAAFSQGESLVAPVVLVTLWLAVSFVLVMLGIFINPAMRRRLSRRHDPSQFGRVRTVDERVVRAEEGCDERCTACRSAIENGLIRRYREEYAIAGVPVYTHSEGYNHYCLECATADVLNESAASGGMTERSGSRADDRVLERR